VSDLRNYANYITAMIALWRNEKKSRHLLKNKKNKQNHHLENKSHPHGFGRKWRKK